MGDGATVKISDGGSKFNALGSAGKGIKITAGDGKNEITGSAQSDFITTGSANDKVYAHRGDNVIDVGDGDDIVTARDGNDTVAFGFTVVALVPFALITQPAFAIAVVAFN